MPLKADLVKVMDVLLGRPLCALVGWSGIARARQPAPDPRAILVIRPGGIGDAVLFIPLLQELRRAWPQARIDLLAEARNAGIVDGTGLVDEVYRYDRLRKGLWSVLRNRYDLVIDTEQFHCLSALVALATRAPRRIGFGTNSRRRLFTEPVNYDHERYEAFLFLELARCATGAAPTWDPDRPFFEPPAGAVTFADVVLQELQGARLAVIHPGASIPERRWPPQRYAELASGLVADGFGIVVVGGRADRDAAQGIADAVGGRGLVNLCGRASLQEVAAVIARAAVYISADTGPLHLAYAVGTPTVHLFGAGVLTKWGPPGRRFVSVAAKVPCSPCTVHGYTPPCCQGLACMLGISADEVRRLANVQASRNGTVAQPPRHVQQQ